MKIGIPDEVLEMRHMHERMHTQALTPAFNFLLLIQISHLTKPSNTISVDFQNGCSLSTNF